MGEYQENSLGRSVFQRIRDDILQGKYEEHDELRENTIGMELGVSRTPVREALRQLELEGLVSITPNKGAYVTGISQKDTKDILVIRSMLEGLCTKWATDNITEEQLDELEEILLLSEFYMKREGDTMAEQMAELDGRFHAILYDASHSRILGHMLTDFHKYVQQARKTSVLSEERARKSIREHRQLLRAIRDKDSDLAEQLANEHIMHVIQNLKRREHEGEYGGAYENGED